MEIAWFSDTWLPTIDGVVRSMLMFKKELEKKGNNIYIFVPGKENSNNDKIFYYKSKPFSKYKNYRIASILSLLSKRTENIIKKIEPSVIHSHSPGILGIHAIIASYKHKLPLFFTFHTFVSDSIYLLFHGKMQEIAKKMLDAWLKWYMKRCSCIIAPSNFVAKEIKRKFGIDALIMPTGIDTKRFEKGDGKKIRKKYGNKKIVLHVGRIVKEKNIDLLIKAAPYILKKEDVIFIIVGEGPAKEEMKEMVKRKGLQKHFVFTGFVPDEELIEYYKAADVFAFPSIYETQGIVAFEAMAASIPIAAARYKAIPDFIKDGYNGYLFNPFDAREMAEKIIAAMNDKYIVKNALEFVKQYSIEKMADRLLEIYERHC